MMLDVLFFAPPGGQVIATDPATSEESGFDRSGSQDGNSALSRLVVVPQGGTRTVSFHVQLPQGRSVPWSCGTTPTASETPVTIDASCGSLFLARRRDGRRGLRVGRIQPPSVKMRARANGQMTVTTFPTMFRTRHESAHTPPSSAGPASADHRIGGIRTIVAQNQVFSPSGIVTGPKQRGDGEIAAYVVQSFTRG